MGNTGSTALTAMEAGLARCHLCGKLQPAPTTEHANCTRCNSHLHLRKKESLQRSWAFLLTGLILYFPANLYPIMLTVSLGQPEKSTIIGGVILLWNHGSESVAAVIFIASILIPILKFLVIGFLLLTTSFPGIANLSQFTRLFRITEYVGPWSMIDVFVVTLLVALIQFGGIASVHPGAAALAFAGMVVSTMFSAMAFDTRLLWDNR